jgi:DNA-directed RNA polymerase subunit RPC12/RpoP
MIHFACLCCGNEITVPITAKIVSCKKCGAINYLDLRRGKPFAWLYNCREALEDIDFYYSGKGANTPEQEKALNRALYGHMVVGSTKEKHQIACQKCWDYYQEMKRKHCGG